MTTAWWGSSEMATLFSGLVIDSSDFSGALRAAREVAQSLPEDEVDGFIRAVKQLADWGQATILILDDRRSTAQLLASSDLIDLIRMYRPLTVAGLEM